MEENVLLMPGVKGQITAGSIQGLRDSILTLTLTRCGISTVKRRFLRVNLFRRPASAKNGGKKTGGRRPREATDSARRRSVELFVYDKVGEAAALKSGMEKFVNGYNVQPLKY